MKLEEVKKLKKHDKVFIAGKPGTVTAKGFDCVVIMEEDPSNEGMGITGIVSWKDYPSDFPTPEPINHLTPCN